MKYAYLVIGVLLAGLVVACSPADDAPIPEAGELPSEESLDELAALEEDLSLEEMESFEEDVESVEW